MMVADPRRRTRTKVKSESLVPLPDAVHELRVKERLRGHEFIGYKDDMPAVRRWRPSNKYPIVPSEPWVEAHIISQDGLVVRNRFFQTKTLPPGMARCPVCERETPPIYMTSSGHCHDCHLSAMSGLRLQLLPGSASIISTAKAKSAARRGEQYHGGA